MEVKREALDVLNSHFNNVVVNGIALADAITSHRPSASSAVGETVISVSQVDCDIKIEPVACSEIDDGQVFENSLSAASADEKNVLNNSLEAASRQRPLESLSAECSKTGDRQLEPRKRKRAVVSSDSFDANDLRPLDTEQLSARTETAASNQPKRHTDSEAAPTNTLSVLYEYNPVEPRSVKRLASSDAILDDIPSASAEHVDDAIPAGQQENSDVCSHAEQHVPPIRLVRTTRWKRRNSSSTSSREASSPIAHSRNRAVSSFRRIQVHDSDDNDDAGSSNEPEFCSSCTAVTVLGESDRRQILQLINTGVITTWYDLITAVGEPCTPAQAKRIACIYFGADHFLTLTNNDVGPVLKHLKYEPHIPLTIIWRVAAACRRLQWQHKKAARKVDIFDANKETDWMSDGSLLEVRPKPVKRHRELRWRPMLASKLASQLDLSTGLVCNIICHYLSEYAFLVCMPVEMSVCSACQVGKPPVVHKPYAGAAVACRRERAYTDVHVKVARDFFAELIGNSNYEFDGGTNVTVPCTGRKFADHLNLRYQTAYQLAKHRFPGICFTASLRGPRTSRTRIDSELIQRASALLQCQSIDRGRRAADAGRKAKSKADAASDSDSSYSTPDDDDDDDVSSDNSSSTWCSRTGKRKKKRPPEISSQADVAVATADQPAANISVKQLAEQLGIKLYTANTLRRRFFAHVKFPTASRGAPKTTCRKVPSSRIAAPPPPPLSAEQIDAVTKLLCEHAAGVQFVRREASAVAEQPKLAPMSAELLAHLVSAPSVESVRYALKDRFAWALAKGVACLTYGDDVAEKRRRRRRTREVSCSDHVVERVDRAAASVQKLRMHIRTEYVEKTNLNISAREIASKFGLPVATVYKVLTTEFEFAAYWAQVTQAHPARGLSYLKHVADRMRPCMELNEERIRNRRNLVWDIKNIAKYIRVNEASVCRAARIYYAGSSIADEAARRPPAELQSTGDDVVKQVWQILSSENEYAPLYCTLPSEISRRIGIMSTRQLYVLLSHPPLSEQVSVGVWKQRLYQRYRFEVERFRIALERNHGMWVADVAKQLVDIPYKRLAMYWHLFFKEVAVNSAAGRQTVHLSKEFSFSATAPMVEALQTEMVCIAVRSATKLPSNNADFTDSDGSANNAEKSAENDHEEYVNVHSDLCFKFKIGYTTLMHALQLINDMKPNTLPVYLFPPPPPKPAQSVAASELANLPDTPLPEHVALVEEMRRILNRALFMGNERLAKRLKLGRDARKMVDALRKRYMPAQYNTPCGLNIELLNIIASATPETTNDELAKRVIDRINTLQQPDSTVAHATAVQPAAAAAATEMEARLFQKRLEARIAGLRWRQFVDDRKSVQCNSKGRRKTLSVRKLLQTTAAVAANAEPAARRKHGKKLPKIAPPPAANTAATTNAAVRRELLLPTTTARTKAGVRERLQNLQKQQQQQPAPIAHANADVVVDNSSLHRAYPQLSALMSYTQTNQPTTATARKSMTAYRPMQQSATVSQPPPPHNNTNVTQQAMPPRILTRLPAAVAHASRAVVNSYRRLANSIQHAPHVSPVSTQQQQSNYHQPAQPTAGEYFAAIAVRCSAASSMAPPPSYEQPLATSAGVQYTLVAAGARCQMPTEQSQWRSSDQNCAVFNNGMPPPPPPLPAGVAPEQQNMQFAPVHHAGSYMVDSNNTGGSALHVIRPPFGPSMHVTPYRTMLPPMTAYHQPTTTTTSSAYDFSRDYSSHAPLPLKQQPAAYSTPLCPPPACFFQVNPQQQQQQHAGGEHFLITNTGQKLYPVSALRQPQPYTPFMFKPPLLRRAPLPSAAANPPAPSPPSQNGAMPHAAHYPLAAFPEHANNNQRPAANMLPAAAVENIIHTANREQASYRTPPPGVICSDAELRAHLQLMHREFARQPLIANIELVQRLALPIARIEYVRMMYHKLVRMANERRRDGTPSNSAAAITSARNDDDDVQIIGSNPRKGGTTSELPSAPKTSVVLLPACVWVPVAGPPQQGQPLLRQQQQQAFTPMLTPIVAAAGTVPVVAHALSHAVPPINNTNYSSINTTATSGIAAAVDNTSVPSFTQYIGLEPTQQHQSSLDSEATTSSSRMPADDDDDDSEIINWLLG